MTGLRHRPHRHEDRRDASPNRDWLLMRPAGGHAAELADRPIQLSALVNPTAT
jgi:hypothetical protein